MSENIINSQDGVETYVNTTPQISNQKLSNEGASLPGEVPDFTGLLAKINGHAKEDGSSEEEPSDKGVSGAQETLPENNIDQSEPEEAVEEDENTEATPKEQPTEETQSIRQSDYDKAQAEIARYTKDLYETKKWGHGASRKLSEAQNIIDNLIDEGHVDEEAVAKLRNCLAHERKDVTYTPEAEPNVYKECIDTVDAELANILKYTKDKKEASTAYNYRIAFQHWLANTPTAEAEKVFEEILPQSSDPEALTNTILNFGRTYYNDHFGKVIEAGGLRPMIHQYEKTLQKQKKELDKMHKEVASLKQNRGYTSQHSYNLPSGSSASSEKRHVNKESITDMLEESRRNNIDGRVFY